MLARSRSLPPSYGRRRRDASPVLHRTKRRTQSFSMREMSKELRMLDAYEELHKRRLERLKALEMKLNSMLDLKISVLDHLLARLQKLIKDPLLDPDERERRKEWICKKIDEVGSCEKEDELIAAVRELENKEEEFINKLELNRTMEILRIRRKNA